MKTAFRKAVALIAFGPFILMIHLTSLIMGRRRAIRLWGPVVTFVTRLSLNVFVPKIRDASEFDVFMRRFESRLSWAWEPLFDVQMEQDGPDAFKLQVTNCPFCEVFANSGLAEMGPYVCQADWDLARDNYDSVVFERCHQIGTRDAFCDHTYRRRQVREEE